MDPAKLPTFEKVIFGEAGLQTIIVTTPNKDYNVNYTGMNEDTMRHEDHRFEWTSHDFKNWAEKTAETYGYEVIIKGIGEPDGNNITSTQMGCLKNADRNTRVFPHSNDWCYLEREDNICKQAF